MPESCALTITNSKGLHARAAAKFVATARQYDAEVNVACNGASASANSIMDLLMLTAGQGAVLQLTATGKQAVAVLQALTELVNGGFDES